MTTALERYLEHTADEPITDPVEALRFFCSLSMSGQDWLDVERLFDAASKERNELHTKNEWLRDALIDLKEAVEYTPLGVRGIVSLSKARTLLGETK